MSSTEVAKREPITMDTMLADLRERHDLQVNNSEEVAERLVQQALEADTIEEVFGGGGTVSPMDILGVPLIVEGVQWNESDIDEASLPFYAIIHARDAGTAKRITVMTGARQTCAQLYVAEAHNAFPLPLVFKASKVKPGRSPAVWLEMWR